MVEVSSPRNFQQSLRKQTDDQSEISFSPEKQTSFTLYPSEIKPSPNANESVSQGLFHFITFKEFKRILWVLLKATVPTIFSHLTDFLTGLISLGFVGKYGNDSQLAGATLANTWANVFCLGILFSINQGFAVTAAQLFGARRLRDAGIIYQKTLVILGGFLIPLVLTLIFAEKFLIAIGLDADIAVNTGLYLRSIIPSLIALSIFDCTKFFLVSQDHFFFQGILQSFMVAVHVGWCYFFVVHRNMPVSGAALAKSVTDVTSAIILVAYVHFSGVLGESWIPWTRNCFTKVGEYLKHTAVIGANLYVEWISFEISVFIAGMLGNEHVLGAHGIAITLVMVIFMFPLGSNTVMQAYIGNAVGEGNKAKTQKFMVAGLFLNGVFTLLNVFILIVFNKQISGFLTKAPETEEVLRHFMYIYVIAHILDTNVNLLAAVLRTLGRAKEVLISFFSCYAVINLTGQYIFAVRLRWGYMFLWISYIFAVIVMITLMVTKTRNMNWDKEIQDIKNKMESPTFHEILHEGDEPEEEETRSLLQT